MKDLKHIHFYESLLEQANNELVQQAAADGGVAVGYTCYYLPEALLNCGKAFSVRLRAPNTGSLDISQYYMTSFICGYVRALFERAFEGGFNFLDFYASSDTCQQMVRVVENIHELNLIDRVYIIACGTSYHAGLIAKEMELCAVFEEISEFRKADNPVITPREFHILCLVSYACPSALILPYLRETLEDLRQRAPDSVDPWRARVVVVGGELDDYAFSEILENCRCYVAADRYCFGAFPGRQQIPLREDAPALEQVCDFYLETNECPRFMSQEKILQRRETVKQLAEEYRADGVLYEQPKFCDFWGSARHAATSTIWRKTSPVH